MSKLLVFMTLLALIAVNAEAQVSERHPECGTISGASTDDMLHLRRFCGLIQDGLPGLESIEANSSVLVLNVSPVRALSMLDNPKLTEEIVKHSMGIWKMVAGSPDVTVYISYFLQDRRLGLAKGTTTPSGDEVTILN